MELLQLHYFLEVAEQEHLTRVAERLYVSPSAISSSISRLEAELGVQLFSRSGRSIKLNENGLMFRTYVQRALAELDTGSQLLRAHNAEEEHNLTLVLTNPYVWQPVLSKFSNKYPDVVFYHSLFDPITAGVRLPSSRADCMICSPDSFNEAGWDYKMLFTDRVALAVPPGHRFANRDSVFLSECVDEMFVNLAECAFSKFTDALCREAGFIPKSRFTCDYMIRPMIAYTENMVALTTFNTRHAGMFSNMKLIPLADKNAIRNQAVFYPTSKHISPVTMQFIDFICDYYSDYEPQKY